MCGNYSRAETIWGNMVVSVLSILLCNANLNSFLTRCGNYSRGETNQGRKLYEEIWYSSFWLTFFIKCKHRNLYCLSFSWLLSQVMRAISANWYILWCHYSTSHLLWFISKYICRWIDMQSRHWQWNLATIICLLPMIS